MSSTSRINNSLGLEYILLVEVVGGAKRTYLALALLILLTINVYLTYAQCIISSRNNIALAVTSTPEGYKGVPTNLTVSILYPGHGDVYVSSKPLSELDFQSSARIAYLVASYVANINPKNYDVLISISAPTTIIGGPSAGGVMTVTIAASLMNLSLRDDVAMTGTINLDGTIGPVGGLLEKMYAAKEAGKKYFLIPAGQSLTYRTRVVEERHGAVVITRVVREPVNLTELGKEIGIEVVEVGNIYDALKYFTGLDIRSRLPFKEPKLSIKYIEVLEKWVKYFNSTYSELLANLTMKLDKIPLTYRDFFNNNVERAKELYRNSVKYLNEGRYYSAISNLFVATYILDYLNTLIDVYVLNNREVLNELINEVNESLANVKDSLFNVSTDNLNDISILAEARLRYYEAEESFNESLTHLRSNDLVSAVNSLVYSMWRLVTVETWLDFLGKGVSISVSQVTIKELTEYLALYAESAYQYASLLIGEGRSANLDNAGEFLSKAKELLDEGDYYASLSYSISSIAYSLTAIHEVYTGNLNVVIENLKDMVYIAYGYALLNNLSVLPALSYFERAKVLEEEGDYLSAIYFYELSAVTMRSYYLLRILQGNAKTQGEVSNLNTTSPSIITTTSKPEVSTSITKEVTSTKGQGIQDILNFLIPVMTLIVIGVILAIILSRSRVSHT